MARESNVSASAATGPLAGIKVVEFAGIGPGPFAAMMLSDMGADVVSVVRPGGGRRDNRDTVNRGRRIVELDLKKADDLAQVQELIAAADVLLEGFRPQVMERLGLGPEAMLARQPRLVYGRMTGWGQSGPLAQAAGHDINYIAITGALDSFRASNGEAVSPLNLVGDYGGGALFLVVGVLAALVEAGRSGRGQVVDAAMCDGVSLMLSMFHSMRAMGRWSEQTRRNMLDGGAHYYRPYQCADGRTIAIGAIEPQFYAELRRLVGMADEDFAVQHDPARWPAQQQKLEAIFAQKTRDEWVALLEGTEACAAGVVGLFEAPQHPHLAARNTFVEVAGQLQPAPAPRFSRTPSAIQGPPAVPVSRVADVLAAWASSPSPAAKS
jgi:alpha-methylacyl-CoA racemase